MPCTLVVENVTSDDELLIAKSYTLWQISSLPPVEMDYISPIRNGAVWF
jgi:hypothetical protein